MDIKKLKRALSLASGSLHTSELVPVLSHFCFENNRVYAYNDKCATTVSLDHDMHLAVKGDVLVKLLDGSSDDARLTVLDGDQGIRFVDGRRSYIDLPTLDSDFFIYEKPQEKYRTVFTVTEEFMEGMLYARANISKTNMLPKMEGLSFTYEPSSSLVLIYSTDDIAITKVSVQDVDMASEVVGRGFFIIPQASILQMIEVYKELREYKSLCELSVGNSHAIFKMTADDMDVEVLTKLIPEEPIDFEQTIGHISRGGVKIEMLDDFTEILNKCTIIGGTDYHGIVNATIRDNILTMKSTGKYGNLSKSWKLPNGIRNQSFKFSAKLAMKNSKGTTELMFGNSGMVFYNENKLNIVGYLEEDRE